MISTLIFAFTAGLISFASPCVLPIIPGFLAYLGGSSVQESGTHRMRIFLNSAFFVLGFASIFSLLGVLLNTVLIHIAYGAQLWLGRIGGLIMIFFGLYLTGLIHVWSLDRPYKASVKKFNSQFFTSFVFGAAFAAGWTPCVGAVLGSILALAATQPTSAFFLLFTYSIGLGLPFLLVGLFTAQASVFINRTIHIFPYIKIVFGILLIGIGILAFTQNLSLLANFGIINQLLLRK